MAEATQFDHDRLSHLLADRLLHVPRFQRSYSWEASNVDEYLADLEAARTRDSDYFMGTVVFAESGEDTQRQLIVDGQQRLATTAVLLVAIRDLLKEYDKENQAKHIDEAYLQGYDLEAEEMVERLILNPSDQPTYDCILGGRWADIDGRAPLAVAYNRCRQYLTSLAPTKNDYRRLVEVAQQLDSGVQVLVAVASDLPEAYVIFETLNDRGADLTTADLLKNYLFSQAKQHFSYVETLWIKLDSSFDNSEDLVKFIRYEYASRHGRVTTRKLYRALQDNIGSGASNAKRYVQRLDAAQEVYLALRDPDHARWNQLDFDVRDALLAYRRFGFESSMPLLLAAFDQFGDRAAGKLLIKVAGWSVRAQFAGRIGASLAEESFGEAAKAVSTGQAKTQSEVRECLGRLVPNDAEFKLAVRQYGAVSVARAKYLLAMLERAHRRNKSQSTEGLPDWSSKGVTIEHVLAQSRAKSSDGTSTFVGQLGNLALLERGLNRSLEDKPFSDKRETYEASTFALTKMLSSLALWNAEEVSKRIDYLAELACVAWEG